MDKIKLSDYIIEYLCEKNTKEAFVIQGGAVAHLIDSIDKNPSIDYTTCQHEQACAMAADAYSRTSNNLGVAIATSGPGATNLITGIANAYYDSIPVLFITGNVTSFRQSKGLGIRQYGFQETDIVSIAKSITKYCVQLKNPNEIKYILDKAFYEAKNARKGPVLIDIPDDFQRTYINKRDLKSYTSNDDNISKANKNPEILKYLKKAKRPVLVFGNGILASKTQDLAIELAKKLNIPTLFSWPLKGQLFSYEDKLNFGSFGTNSPRYGNFIIQNSDLIISVGNRLDTHATGSLNDFAREAKIISVDIDKYELKKFEHFKKRIDLKIVQDAKSFLTSAINELNFEFKNLDWFKYCKKVKKEFTKKEKFDCDFVSPKLFFSKLSKICDAKTMFIGDTGANLVYLFNNLEEKLGQKYISAFNNTPMGFSLPASIGVSKANPKSKVICCIGDGGIQMNIQELATIKYYNLPIVIFVFNNFGHGMIKQTQDDWFNSNYSASSSKKGIPKIDFKNIAKAYEIKSYKISNNKQINKILKKIDFNEPILIELVLDEKLRIDPMLQFGRPLEDMNPLLNRKDFMKYMIIKPTEISKKEI